MEKIFVRGSKICLVMVIAHAPVYVCMSFDTMFDLTKFKKDYYHFHRYIVKRLDK